MPIVAADSIPTRLVDERAETIRAAPFGETVINENTGERVIFGHWRQEFAPKGETPSFKGTMFHSEIDPDGNTFLQVFVVNHDGTIDVREIVRSPSLQSGTTEGLVISDTDVIPGLFSSAELVPYDDGMRLVCVPNPAPVVDPSP